MKKYIVICCTKENTGPVFPFDTYEQAYDFMRGECDKGFKGLQDVIKDQSASPTDVFWSIREIEAPVGIMVSDDIIKMYSAIRYGLGVLVSKYQPDYSDPRYRKTVESEEIWDELYDIEKIVFDFERKLWTEDHTVIEATISRLPFISVWDGGTEIESMATLNTLTGEVSDIELKCVYGLGLEVLDGQYVIVNDERVRVYADENGYDYWADLRGDWVVKK
jgi:hypothetical protein